MKNWKFRLKLCFIIFSLINIDSYSQRYIKDFPEYTQSFLKDIIKVDTTFYTYTYGNNPRVLAFNKDGSIIKDISFANEFSKILCIEEHDRKLYIGGHTGENSSKKSKLVVVDLDGNLLSVYQYELMYITSIYFNNSGIYLGGRLKKIGASSSSGLIKLNLNGTKQWVKEYQFYSNSQISKIGEINGDIFTLNYATTVGVGFTGFVLCKVNHQNGGIIKRTNIETGYFDGFELYDDTFNPIDIVMAVNSIFIICAGESYGTGSGVFEFNTQLELVNTVKLTTNYKANHPMSISISNSSLFICGYTEIENKKSGFIRKLKLNGEIIWHKNTLQNIPHSLIIDDEYIYGVGSVNVYNNEEPFYPMLMRISSDGKLNNTNTFVSISDVLFCGSDETSKAQDSIYVVINKMSYIIDPENITSIDLPDGRYPLTYSIPVSYELCNSPDTLIVSNNFSNINLKLYKKECIDVICGITVSELVRGKQNKFYINVRNRGSIKGFNVKLNLKSNLSLLNLTSPHTFIMKSKNEIELMIDKIESNQTLIIPFDFIASQNLPLFSKNNMNIKIESKNSCVKEYETYLGSNLEISSKCTNGKIQISVENQGSDMIDSTSLSVLRDGYFQNKVNIKLESLQNYDFQFDATGHNYSFVLKEENDNILQNYEVLAVEGCKTFPNNYFSKGVNQSYANTVLNFLESESKFEVTDHRDGNKIFQINKGEGYYHYISDDVLWHEYSLRYINELQVPVTKLYITLGISHTFNLNSFIQLASSHKSNFLIKDDQIFLQINDIILLPGDEFHYRFIFKLSEKPKQKGLIIVEASGLVNDAFQINFKPAFNNVKNTLDKDSQSPHAFTNKGQILGKHDAIDFYTTMKVLNDDSKLIVSTYLEAGNGYITVISFIDTNEKLMWEKTYAFKQGGSVISEIVEMDDDNFLLFGRIDDKDIPINYLGYGYTLIFCIDKKGMVKWEKVWRFDNVNKFTGSISFAYSSKIGAIFGGQMLTTQGYKYYYCSVDINGRVGEINILNIKGDLFSCESDDYILILGGYSSGVQFDHNYIAIDKTGYESFSGTIPNKELDVRISDIALKKNILIILGRYYSATHGKYLSNISTYNINSKLIFKHEIEGQNAYYFDPKHILILDSSYLIAGDLAKDSSFNIDVGVAEIDLSGNVVWESSHDFGSSDYAEGIFYKNEKIYIPVQTQASDDIYNLQYGYYATSKPIINTINENYKDKISVFPNPSSNRLNIKSDIVKIYSISIFDFFGRKIYHKDVSDETEIIVNINDFQNGYYFLDIVDKSNIHHSVKFIKI